MDLPSHPANSWLGVLGSSEMLECGSGCSFFVSGRQLRLQASDHRARLGAKEPGFLSESGAIRQGDLGLPPSYFPSSRSIVASGPSLPCSLSASTAGQLRSPTTFQASAQPVGWQPVGCSQSQGFHQRTSEKATFLNLVFGEAF